MPDRRGEDHGRLPPAVPVVIHTVGPVWRGESEGEDGLLAECYHSCLRLAGERGLSSIAFPAIGTGAYGFPFERAARIAVTAVLEILPDTPSIGRVIFVCHGREAAAIYRRILSELLQQESPLLGKGIPSPRQEHRRTGK